MPTLRRPADPSRPDLGAVQEACWLALQLADRLKSSFAAHATACGLTVIQAKILLQLQPGEGLPMRALASQVGSDPSNLTAPIDKLETRGAVTRLPGTADRRVKSIVLTGEGGRLRADFWHGLTNDPGPIDHLSAGQVASLRDILRAAVQAEVAAPQAGAAG